MLKKSHRILSNFSYNFALSHRFFHVAYGMYEYDIFIIFQISKFNHSLFPGRYGIFVIIWFNKWRIFYKY